MQSALPKQPRRQAIRYGGNVSDLVTILPQASTSFHKATTHSNLQHMWGYHVSDPVKSLPQASTKPPHIAVCNMCGAMVFYTLRLIHPFRSTVCALGRKLRYYQAQSTKSVHTSVSTSYAIMLPRNAPHSHYYAQSDAYLHAFSANHSAATWTRARISQGGTLTSCSVNNAYRRALKYQRSILFPTSPYPKTYS
jgi:hypothetical protein